MKKHLVVFSGAGISAESGLRTFRDSNGLWENYRITQVATFEAWQRNPQLVLEFYNMRRKQCIDAQPNDAHTIIASLQTQYRVSVITQNIDNLHERAGSTNVLHLHGEIMKVRSTTDNNLIYPINKWNLEMGDICEKGSQLRPHIVWFGEDVPMIPEAANIITTADVLLVVGTSLVVYPAAGLIDYAPKNSAKYLIDPGDFTTRNIRQFIHIKAKATDGMKEVQKILSAY